MSLFLSGHHAFTKMMIFWAFIVFICLLETPVMARRENSEVDELLVNWAGYGEEKLSTVVISGKLVCHADANHKTSVHPNPVSGASMAVSCGTSGKTKESLVKGNTDSYGEFLIDLPSHLHSIPNLEKICCVTVLHLPNDSPCRKAFTGKHKEIKLASIGEGVRTYTTHNIHLMPKPSQGHKRKGGKKESTVKK